MGSMGQVFLFVVCVLMPWLVIKGHIASKKPGAYAPNYRRHIVTALVVQVFMVLLALGAARENEVDLFRPIRFSPIPVGAAVVLFAVMVGTMGLRQKLTDPRILQRRERTRPKTRADMGWWTVISLTAGVCEEIVYRGVLMAMLMPWVGENWWAAALISTTAFALAHMSQGWVNAVSIFLFTLGLHWIVRESGNLYTAMILHVAYDFAAGLLFARRWRREEAREALQSP